MAGENPSRPRDRLNTLNTMDWFRERGIRITEDKVPASLNDVIFLTREEVGMDTHRRVGGGSFGDVYRGSLYNQEVAIKVFKVQNSVARVGQLVGSDDGSEMQEQNSKAQKTMDLLKALEREVRVLKSISFGRIVQFYGVCLEPAAIVTEYCPNKSLFDYIGHARTDERYADALTWRTRLQIACDAASGMNYLHSRENAIVHRDLKSPNLLLDENMKCKICDFNTAKFVGTKAVTNSISSNNPLWLAPEILQGFQFTKASDVYPFGIILWELMTWMVPFEVNGEPKNAHAVMFGVVFKNDRPDIPENDELIGGPCPIYKDYCCLMEQCWHREPEKRPSFYEIVKELNAFLSRERQSASSQQSETKPADRSQSLTRLSRFRFPFRSSLLKRSKHMSKDIEEQIRQKNPDIEASWQDDYEEDALRDMDQLPTPFARGLPSTTSNESYANEMMPPPGNLAHAADGPPGEKLDLKTYLSGISARSLGTRGTSSQQSTARSRWNKIRDVVMLISARKRAHEMLSKLGIETISVADEETPSEPGNEDPNMEIHGGLQQIDENQPVQPKVDDAKPRDSKWNLIRAIVCPDVRPTTRDYWKLLARHMSVTTELHTSTSIRPSTSGTEPPAAVRSRAAVNWARVRDILEMHDLDGYPRTPASWQPLMDVLFPSENSHSQPVQRRANQRGTSKSPAPEDQIKHWLVVHDPLIRKHQSFLESVSSIIGMRNLDDNSGPGSASHHEPAVTKRRFESQEMWDFVRDCILETSLPDAWDPVTKFIRDCTNISSHELSTLRDLMSKAEEAQTHEVSGILKPLIF